MAGQGLKNGIMLAIDGKYSNTALSLTHHQFPGHHQWLFIGDRHVLSASNGGQSWCQPCAADNSREHKIDLRQAGNRTAPVRAVKDFNSQIRGSLPQLLSPLQVEY